MVKGLKEPKLRFSEYRGTAGWEEVRLGGVIEVAPKSKRKASEGSLEGLYPFYTNSTEDSKQFIDESDLEGEYVIANTGGKAYFEYIDGEFAYMSDCFVFTSKTINPRFLFDLLKCKTDYINELGFTGSGLKHLDKDWFNNLNLFVPKGVLEQQKLGSFFTLLDQKIQKQQEKVYNLTLYKKGLLQKVMNQEIRFKDDEGQEYPEWEEMMLGKIVEYTNSNISLNSLKDFKGEELYPLYDANSIVKYIDEYKKDKPYISIIKDGAGIGRLFKCEPYSSVLGTMGYIEEKEGVDLEFIYCVLQTINFEEYRLGTTIPHIYFKDYSLRKVYKPCLEEQQKIASLFSTIDKKIESEQQKLSCLVEQKKGFMQKMFV